MPRRVAPFVLLLLLLWLLPLGSWRLFNPDEGRYAEIPREMLVSGDWVTPRLNHIKYFEKPPLQYWATAVAFKAFGVHEWTARLWTALSGALGVLGVLWLGWRLYGRTTGLIAALVLAGSSYYAVLGHLITTDMSLSFGLEFALGGLVLLVAGRPERDRRLGVWLLSTGLTLAFLSKGLVGVVIPVGVAGLYLLIRRDFGLLLRARPWWPLLALLLIAGPWVYAVSVRNPEFLRFFFVHEHFERFLTRVHDRYEPFWYFIPVLLAGFIPWVTLLPRIAADTWRDLRKGDGAAWMLALWVLFILAFFSLSQSKLVPYIVPAFPALALLAGRALARIELRRLGLHLALMAVATLLLLAALFAVASSTRGAALLAQLDGPGRVGAIAALLLGAAGCALGALQAHRGQRLAAIYAAALATLVTVMALFWASNGTDRQRNQMEVIASLQAAMKPDSEFYCVAVYVQPVVFYLERPCTLVGYKGELAFGIGQEPWHHIPDLAGFAAHWRSGVDPVALVRPEVYAQLAQMRLPMRVIYTARSYVAVVRQ